MKAALLTCICVCAAMAAHASERVLDDFSDPSRWQVATSEEVKASLRSAPGSGGHALCMDFDFGSVSGYAVARRALPLEYAANYEFSFGIRGDAPPNALQFKLVEASGENVWWVNRPDYVLPHEWQRLRVKRRDISFAWGPAQDRELRRSAQVEFVIARGRGGGSGSVCFERLALRQLPQDNATTRLRPSAQASSSMPENEPVKALDGDPASAWRSDPVTGTAQTFTLDFGQPRELGGVVLRWLPDAFATRYVIELSDDGQQWRAVRNVRHGVGGINPHLLPETETRFLRVRMLDGPKKTYGLAEVEIKDLAFGASANAFFSALAREAPRGHYPRGFVGEQSYWTVLGIDGGTAHGLLSEDGALEIASQLGSIEPFLLTDDGLVSWADATIQQALQDGYLPIPSVQWRRDDLTLDVAAFGAGTRDRSQLLARYTLTNESTRARTVTLALAVRPFQVNPPTQFLNTPGGVTPIHALEWDGAALTIDGQRRVFPLQPPSRVVLGEFDAGNVPRLLSDAAMHTETTVRDEAGFASALLLYRLELPPGASRSVGLVAPLTGEPTLPSIDAETWFAQQQAETADRWRSRLDTVTLRLPAAGQALRDTLRTATAHILISRNGPALQPGVRAYARSWIRDGAMISDALLRLGHADVVREFADWFAPYQFPNGKVPCCVDARGADPVAENDSHGELIYLIGQYHRYAQDREWLARMWTHVASAILYMNTLRAQERGAKNQSPERRALFGLMPASISHEGYSDRPAYAYWDDFWALAGYDAAVDIAAALGKPEEAASIAAQRDEFRSDLQASIRASIVQHGIDFIPGSADRGDFDASATTVGLSVAGEQARLPQDALHATFERYWKFFVARRDGALAWNDYTPYELRNVGAFVRLGWRARAQNLLGYFLTDRRPQGWNQWAEVVGRDARQPRFLGDMPHAWIASDFIQAVLDGFAFSRAEDQALVIAAGVPTDWLDGEGIGVEGLRTPYGKLSYRLRREGSKLRLDIAGDLKTPPGGFVVSWPYAAAPMRITVNGREAQMSEGNELRVGEVPANIIVELR